MFFNDSRVIKRGYKSLWASDLHFHAFPDLFLSQVRDDGIRAVNWPSIRDVENYHSGDLCCLLLLPLLLLLFFFFFDFLRL